MMASGAEKEQKCKTIMYLQFCLKSSFARLPFFLCSKADCYVEIENLLCFYLLLFCICRDLEAEDSDDEEDVSFEVGMCNISTHVLASR